jgi:CheY-like chemotaxis protein
VAALTRRSALSPPIFIGRLLRLRAFGFVEPGKKSAARTHPSRVRFRALEQSVLRWAHGDVRGPCGAPAVGVGPRLPVVQTACQPQAKETRDAAEPNSSWCFLLRAWKLRGCRRERVISKFGPESWFEQRPKVIVEDDERRPKVVVVEDDALLRRKVSTALRSEGFQILEAATAHEAFLLFKCVPGVGVAISDTRAIGAMKDGTLVGMHVSEYLRHCGYRVLEAPNSDEALLLLHNPDTRVDVVMIDVGGSGAMSGFKLTQRLHTFLASWGLGDWLLGIGRCLRAEYRALGVPGPLPPRLAALVKNTAEASHEETGKSIHRNPGRTATHPQPYLR